MKNKSQELSLNKLIFASIGLLILVILIVIFLGISENAIENKPIQDKGIYDYCIEWDGYVKRDNLLRDCFDFKNLKERCIYDIKDNVLTAFDLNYTVIYKSYDCTRYVKSIGYDETKQK